jgi:hypothetical protein
MRTNTQTFLSRTKYSGTFNANDLLLPRSDAAKPTGCEHPGINAKDPYVTANVLNERFMHAARQEEVQLCQVFRDK